MTMVQNATTLTQAGTSTRFGVAALVFLMGAVLVFGTGFAHPQALHDAAHDARHSMSFPCH
jgi:cobalt transporter subunit CbtB